MRKAKNPRPKTPVKKAGRASAMPRRKKATAAKHAERPVAVTPPAQVAPPARMASPLMLWPALPFAMLRLWLGPRDAATRK
jgi:hypothetical protein